MMREDEQGIAELVKMIQSEDDPAKLIPLMTELNEWLGVGAQRTVLRAAIHPRSDLGNVPSLVFSLSH